MGTIGNTYDVNKTKIGHARKVWRSVRHVYPAGAKITNIADFVALGKIPAGTPVKFGANEVVAYTDAQISGAEDATALGINGYMQEDCFIKDGATVGTCTVVYAGEIYEYMFDEAIAEILKGLNVAQIVWVK